MLGLLGGCLFSFAMLAIIFASSGRERPISQTDENLFELAGMLAGASWMVRTSKSWWKMFSEACKFLTISFVANEIALLVTAFAWRDEFFNDNGTYPTARLDSLRSVETICVVSMISCGLCSFLTWRKNRDKIHVNRMTPLLMIGAVILGLLFVISPPSGWVALPALILYLQWRRSQCDRGGKKDDHRG